MLPFGRRSPPTEPVGRWDFAALTDIGRVRANNEDAVAFDADLGLALLADGMGGYNGGEVASDMAITLLRGNFGRWASKVGLPAPARALRRALRSGVDETNDAILDAGMGSQLLQGMGTTLVLAVFGARSVFVGHIGDSRCYRLRGGRLEQLTRDHSLLQEKLDAGLLTPEQAARSNQRNLVTRALGVERGVDLELHEHPVQPGDLYLLCSDGLTEMVPDVELFTLLARDIDLPSLATLLVANANDNGGRDNISVVLARAVKRE